MASAPTAPFEDLLSVRARLGRGAPAPARPVASPRYDFGGGYADPGSFPYDALAEATRHMLQEDGAAALNYGDPQGYRGLRELVCHKYAVFEGLKVAPENIQITNGSSHALSLAFGALVDPGDAVLSEAPTFSGTVRNLLRHGPEVLDVPVDAEGMVIAVAREHLERLRRQGRRCKLIYTIVNFQNPAGPDLSLRRRQELVDLAEEYGTLLLEDDAYGELRFEGEPKPSLYALDRRGRTLRAGTLSKILGPGVRLGWICAPGPMIPVLQSFNFGGGVSPFTSRVATWYMRDHMEAHVGRLVGIYREKRDAMLRGLEEGLGGTDAEISRPQGGFFVWIRLPRGTDPARLMELAVQADISFTPGTAFFPNGGGQEFIRLAYSLPPVQTCYEGARVLARVILEARG